MKGLSEKIVTGGFVLALLLLSGVSVESYLSVQKLIESRRSVEHTHQVIEAFNEILKGMEDAERGRRGYVFLKDNRQLKTLQNSSQETDRAIAKVRQLTQDSPEQQRRLDELEPLVAKNLALLQQFVDLERQKKANQLTRSALIKQTLILQQNIQTRLQEMEHVERILLQQRSAETDASVQRANLVDRIGYFLSFCLLIGIFLLLEKQIRTRKQTELALKKQAEEVYDLYNQAPCGYHSLDAEGTFIRINDTELEWLGYTREELVQKKKFTDLVTPKSLLVFQESFPRFKMRGWISDLEFEMIRKDGTIFPFSLSATAITDAAGNFVMSRSTMFDMRDRQRIEEQRRQAEELLRQANEQLETKVQERTAELVQVNASLQTELLERKRAEAALSDSEKQLRTITNALPVLISYIDSAHRFRFNNQAYEGWFGKSWTTFDGQYLWQALGESVYEAIEPYTKAALSGQEVNYESLVTYQNDITRWISATYIPDFGAEGEVKGYFALVSDITDRKQAEERLRQSEERLQWVLQTMPVMMDAFDADGNIIVWNQECERVTGYCTDEIVGNLQALELFYPNLVYRQQMMAAWSDRGNNYRNWEWDITCKDGSIKTISWSNISEKFPISGWASWGIGVDVTDRKQAEAMLRESEQRLSLAIEGAEMATWDVDIQTGKARWSARHFQLLGYEPTSSGEATLEMWRSRVYPDDLVRVMQAAERATQERSVYRSEHRIIRADNGQVVWIAAFGQALYDEAGKAVRFIGIIFDITDRKRAEQFLQQAKEELEIKVQERTAELKQLNEDLTRSNQELEQFAYVASHDLQEPLRAVTGYTQLLVQDYQDRLDDSAQEYTAYIVDGAKRMQQLIQDLLAYSRVGTRDLTFAPTNCDAVLKQVSRNLQVAIAENNAIITLDSLPTVIADKNQLIQLFQNLMGNAIKFRRQEPPQIHISAELKDGKWLFRVQDNGIGMKSRYLDRIFEIFKRLHTRTEFPGTGIGLAICKKIIDRHSGHIWAESEFGVGTTFYFTIPDPHDPPNV